MTKKKKAVKKKPAKKSKSKPAVKQPAIGCQQRVWEYLDRKKIDKALVYFEGGGDDGAAYKIELIRGKRVVEELDPHVSLKLRESKAPPIEWLLQEPIYEEFNFEGEQHVEDVITWVTKRRELVIPDNFWRL